MTRAWFEGYADGLKGLTAGLAVVTVTEAGLAYVDGWREGVRDADKPVRRPNPYVEAEEWEPPAGLHPDGWFVTMFLTDDQWTCLYILEDIFRGKFRGIGEATAVVSFASRPGFPVNMGERMRGVVRFLTEDGVAHRPHAYSPYTLFLFFD